MTTSSNENVCMMLTSSNIKKAVQSHTMSKRYINTMIRVAIINILHHRLNINEKEFVNKTFHNLPYKSFKSKSKDPLIRQFHVHMTACKDAIEKNYLKEMYYYFIDADTEEILENYKFAFKYSDDKKKVENARNIGETLLETTTQFLQILDDLATHPKIPCDIKIKAEFVFWDETPDKYQPPGFNYIKADNALYNKLPKSDNSVVLAKLSTGFHFMKCRGRGDVFNFNSSIGDVENNDKQEEVREKFQEPDPTIALAENLLTEDMSKCDNNTSISQPNTSRKTADSFGSIIELHLSEDEDELSAINCNCHLTLDPRSLADVKVITCLLCNCKYHMPCQGFCEEGNLTNPYYCLTCKSQEIAQEPKNIRILNARLRLFIYFIVKTNRIPKIFWELFGDFIQSLINEKYFTVDGVKLRDMDSNILDQYFDSKAS